MSRFLFILLLFEATILVANVKTIQVEKISIYNEAEEKYFCVILEIPGYLDVIKYELDIEVKDYSQNTYGHFLLPTGDDKLLWCGRFKKTKKSKLSVKLFSFYSVFELPEVFEVNIDFPPATKEFFNTRVVWKEARNLLQEKYLAQIKNNFLKHSRFRKKNYSKNILFEEEKNIDIETLKTFQLPSSFLPPNDFPITYSMEKIIPNEYLFLHFGLAKNIFSLTKTISSYDDDLLSLFSANGRDHSTTTKLLNTLALNSDEKENKSSGESLIGWVISDVGFIASDFYFDQGNSFGLIANVKSQFLLNYQLKKYFKKAISEGAQQTIKIYNQISYKKIINTKKGIYSYSCYIGKFFVVCNSEIMLQKIIKSAMTRKKTIAKENDFRLTRSIFKLDEEKAFAYISQAYLQKLSSPRYKISEYRRSQCVENLTFLKHEISEHYANYQVFPKTVLRMLHNCPEKGKYSIVQGTPVCSIHNRTGYLTSIDEVSVDKITEKEKTHYEQFRKFYGQKKEIISPLAFRIKKEKQLQIDVFTPSKNSTFKDFEKYLLHTNTKLSKALIPEVFLYVTLSCNVDKLIASPEVQNYLDRIKISYIENLLPYLGKEVSFYLCDNNVSFSPNVTSLSDVLPALVSLPFYVTVALKNSKELLDFNEMIWNIRNIGNVAIVKEFYNKKFYYEIHSYVDSSKYTLYLLIDKGMLVIANKKTTIHSFITNKVKRTLGKKKNLSLFFSASKLQKARNFLRGEAKNLALKKCMNNMVTKEILLRFFPKKTINENILRMYGCAEMVCPTHGKYIFENNAMRCSIHGTKLMPQEIYSNNKHTWPDTSIDLNFTKKGFMLEMKIQGAKN